MPDLEIDESAAIPLSLVYEPSCEEAVLEVFANAPYNEGFYQLTDGKCKFNWPTIKRLALSSIRGSCFQLLVVGTQWYVPNIGPFCGMVEINPVANPFIQPLHMQ